MKKHIKTFIIEPNTEDFKEENTRKIIGSRIMQRRKGMNILQKELAEAVGISDNQISNIENGICFPRMNTFIKICDVLDTTPDYFLLGTIRRKFGSDITDMISCCTPEEQRTLWLLIDTYVHRNDENNI